MRGILLDIEGTTTPIAFVYDILFSYVRTNLKSYLDKRRNDPDCIHDLESLRSEYNHELPSWDPASYCLWLMDRDRKSTALKSIQGKIWAAGYRNGELTGQVFPDVPPALKTWNADGVDVRIFSSGSILAQKLLFSHTADGDLTIYLHGNFDTNIGAKTSPASYQWITSEMGGRPGDIVFVSDATMELDAARNAGMNTLLCVRPGNHPQPNNSYTVIRSFDEIPRL